MWSTVGARTNQWNRLINKTIAGIAELEIMTFPNYRIWRGCEMAQWTTLNHNIHWKYISISQHCIRWQYLGRYISHVLSKKRLWSIATSKTFLFSLQTAVPKKGCQFSSQTPSKIRKNALCNYRFQATYEIRLISSSALYTSCENAIVLIDDSDALSPNSQFIWSIDARSIYIFILSRI